MLKKGIYWYFLFFLLLLIFIRVMQFNGLYGQDSYEYLRYSRALAGFIKSGTYPGDYPWPLLYTIIGAILSFPLTLPFALQLVSIVSLILAANYIEKILVELYAVDRKTAIVYIFLFFLLSPYMLRGSLVVMSDSLAIFFITGAVYYYLQYTSTARSANWIYFVLFSTAAVSTRYAAFIVLIPIIGISAFHFFRNFKLLTFLSSIAIICIIILPHLILRAHTPFSFVHHEWVENWSLSNLLQNHFNTSDGYTSYHFYNIIYGFFNVIHPAFCFIGLILLIACFKVSRVQWKLTKTWPLLLSVLLNAVFLAGIPYQDMRYLLLPFPLIIILLFPGYKSIDSYLLKKQARSYFMLVVIILQIALFCRVFIPFYKDNKTEKYIATRMLTYNHQVLYTFSIDGALKAYGFGGKITNMLQVKIDTVERKDTNFLVLFNEQQFYETWKDRNPMLNWAYLKTHYMIHKKENLPDGWELYSNK